MTKLMTLTGNESASELMELRRSILSTRRRRRAEFLPTEADSHKQLDGTIIRFPSPDHPLIA